jgi:hypothetical protein
MALHGALAIYWTLGLATAGTVHGKPFARYVEQHYNCPPRKSNFGGVCPHPRPGSSTMSFGRSGVRRNRPIGQVPKMIAATKDIIADSIADGADRALLPPRPFFLGGKASAARNDEKAVPIVHVDIVHRILKRREHRRSHRVQGVENATASGNRLKPLRCAKALGAPVARRFPGRQASIARVARHGRDAQR